ncbi:MAG: HAMP domain-containing histidine kinase [Myxococcota bacterium]|nr:HAMP domain-containing histidine kinase [Myxococcota bacterium]
MRAGLRLRILVLLGALLVVSFVPLYFAVATYTSLAFRQVRSTDAELLARVLAARLLEPGIVLERALDKECRAVECLALAVYAADGRVLAERGEQALLEGDSPRALRVSARSRRGSVVLVLPNNERSMLATPLFRLLGLYTLLVALALLVLSYFALTRLIVRPLDQLTRSAERVAGGARRWTLPQTSVPELEQLGRSLGTMTEKLIREEELLRWKISEVESATRDLKEAQHRLVSSERLASVGRLSAGLAHEIGNPIAALIGMLELLLQGGLEEHEQRDFLERMRRETERIHGILRDLLQFARPTSAASDERNQPGDVAAAIADTTTLLAPQKALKDIELSVDVEADLPLVTLGREQLVQVTLNLVLNAADAVGAGGKIILRARSDGATLELTVSDDGPGVSREIRDRLFEPFVTTKEVGRGTGLGLAVCRGLVEAAGGTIELDDAYSGGARFVVRLPVALPAGK